MIKMDYKGKITNQEIPLFEGNNAYLRDFAISNDENAPITAGLFRLKKVIQLPMITPMKR